jgi:uncharacterized membrane protein
MANGSFSLGRAFTEGWQAFTRNTWLAIGGFLAYAGIQIAISNVPCAGPLIGIIVGGPFAGGMCVFALRLLRQANPTVGDVFAGFAKFWLYFGLYWLLALIFFACALPAFGAPLLVGLGVGAAAGEVAGFAVGVPLFLIGFVVLCVIVARWYLTYYVVADDWEEGSVLTALRKSAQITEGCRIKLFLSFLLLGLFGAMGMLVCIVGMLVTAPVATCAVASIYQQLKESAAGASALSVGTGSFAPQETAADDRNAGAAQART